MFSPFARMHRDIVRQIKQGAPLPGCTSIAVSPRFYEKKLYLTVRTNSALSRHMLSLPELQYPLPLFRIACQLYGYIEPYADAKQLAIRDCELLSMARLDRRLDDGIESAGPKINEEEDVIFVPLVAERAVDPAVTPNLSQGQLWRFCLDRLHAEARPDDEANPPPMVQIKFIPDWKSIEAIKEHELRIWQMSVGWSWHRLTRAEVALPDQSMVEGIVRAGKTIVRY